MKAKNLGKKLLIGLIMTTMIMGSMVTNVSKVSAKEIEMEQKTGVPTNKVWSIKLTQTIANEGLSDKIIVKDSSGTTILTKVGVGSDEKTITVAPATAYEDGKTYTLSILEGILSKDKQNSLKDTIKMNFTVSQNATNPVSPIENSLDVVVSLNGKQVVFPADGIQPKFVAGFLYLPLDTMIKAMGYDMKISVDTNPNVTITYPKGLITGDFKSNIITLPQGRKVMQKPILASTDANAKYTGTYATPGFFYEVFGLEMNYTQAKPTGTVSTITHVITLDGNIDSGKTETVGNPADYQMVETTPSTKLNPDKLVNLQNLIKLLPARTVRTNTANRFYYIGIGENADVIASNAFDYFEIRIQGSIDDSPNAVKIIKCILNDTVGSKDATEIYSALQEYNSTFYGNDAVVAKWAKYRATKSGTHQYNFDHVGSTIVLNYK